MSNGAREAVGTIDHPVMELSHRGAEALAIECVQSIGAIDAAEWDEVAGDNVLASHGLLSAIEETGIQDHRSQYFLARSGGRLVGALMGRVEDKDHGDGVVPLGGHRVDKMLAGKFAAAARYSGAVSLPCLMCGNQVGVSEPVVVYPNAGTEEGKQIIEALVTAAEKTARRERWALCFRQVLRENSALADVLIRRGYLRGSELPSAYLDLKPEWQTFADYRKHLRKAHSKMATNVNGELAKAKRLGLVIEPVESPEDCGEKLHGLIEAHNLRHNSKPCPVRADFFKTIKARMGANVAITTARVGDALCAVQVRFQAAGEMVAWMTGIDDRVAREASAYFNLNYNHTIEYMLSAGYRRIFYGPLLWEVKARRGCKALESDFYFRTRNPLQRAILKRLIRVRSERNDALSGPLRHAKAEHSTEGAAGKGGGDEH